jgi:DNA-binding MarR family transcriptional regulator
MSRTTQYAVAECARAIGPATMEEFAYHLGTTTLELKMPFRDASQAGLIATHRVDAQRGIVSWVLTPKGQAALDELE